MKLTQTSIPEVVIIEPTVFEDQRGWFMESFNEQRFREALSDLGLSLPSEFVQDNHSCSKKGVLRGLHYQLDPRAQGKLVRVTCGAAYDVAVDIRKGSVTYGSWVGVKLSAVNQKMLWIPEGFAHGFIALENDTHFLYKTTDYYCKESERCIKWDDPEIGVKWPSVENIQVSEKDDNAVSFMHAETFGSPTIVSGVEIIELNVIGDQRGSLVSIEQIENVPFEIKRVYYIYGTQPGVGRGFHAHQQLEQLAVCVSGRCRMMLDDGKDKKSVWLDSPSKGLLINNMIWREMHDFSEDCVLMVLASEHYDESDYIRNYSEFLEAVEHGNK